MYKRQVESNKIKSSETHINTAASGFRGVGVQAAQFVANQKVDVVITGNIGPHASMILSQLGIKVIVGWIGMKVKDVIEKFLKGETPPEVPRGFGRGYGRMGPRWKS